MLRIHQLRVDAQPVPRPPQTSGQHVRGVQLLPDLQRRHLLVAKRQHRRPRKRIQPANLRKLRDDVFGNPVAQVLIFLRAAQIFEIEHRQRFRPPASPLPTRDSLTSAARFVPRIQIALQSVQIRLQFRRRLAPQIAVLLQQLIQQSAPIPPAKPDSLAPPESDRDSRSHQKSPPTCPLETATVP